MPSFEQRIDAAGIRWLVNAAAFLGGFTVLVMIAESKQHRRRLREGW